jgi:hypothetical protein
MRSTSFKLEEKVYEGRTFYGIKFNKHHEVIYLSTEKLRKKAIDNWKKGKLAKQHKVDFHEGLPFYTSLTY